jgi:hypothetical protein
LRIAGRVNGVRVRRGLAHRMCQLVRQAAPSWGRITITTSSVISLRPSSYYYVPLVTFCVEGIRLCPNTHRHICAYLKLGAFRISLCQSNHRRLLSCRARGGVRNSPPSHNPINPRRDLHTEPFYFTLSHSLAYGKRLIDSAYVMSRRHSIMCHGTS